MHHLQEERDKLKEDLGSARKEIGTLKEMVVRLKHELTSSTQETMIAIDKNAMLTAEV